MKTWSSGAIAATLILLSAGASAASIALESAPACTSDQLWTINASRGTLGVAARSLDAEGIGAHDAEKIVGYTFHPLSVCKETLCGGVDHFDFDAPTPMFAEHDWNHFIDFESNAPIQKYIPDDVSFVSCDGGPCIDAELTPDQAILVNDLIDGPNKKSSAVGQRACAYGALVADRSHGNQPEIHPTEALWWQETTPSDTVTHLLFGQDGSRRFTTLEDYPDFLGSPFEDPSDPPPWWHPWAAPGLRTQAVFVTEIRPGQARSERWLALVKADHLSGQPDGGFDLQEVTGANQSLAVFHDTVGSSLVQRSFQLCRNGGSAYALVVVVAALGTEQLQFGEGGYAILRWSGQPPPPQQQAVASARSTKLDFKSLARVPGKSVPRFAARPFGADRLAQPVTITPAPGELVLRPRLPADARDLVPSTDSAKAAYGAAAGVDVGSVPNSLKRANTLVVEAVPYYVVYAREGSTDVFGISQLSSTLNQALSSPSALRERIFATPPSFPTAWRATAHAQSSGKDTGDPIQLQTKADNSVPTNRRIAITAPSDRSVLYRIEIEATMKGPYATAMPEKISVWSDGLYGRDLRPVADEIFRMLQSVTASGHLNDYSGEPAPVCGPARTGGAEESRQLMWLLSKGVSSPLKANPAELRWLTSVAKRLPPPRPR